ncbi:MAG: NAD(P)-dependent oxidoreductase [Oscillospiraceae bacterium]|nr:NAD(P)-dependent oxidoreductase [Oscillospiraceae bacterium]
MRLVILNDYACNPGDMAWEKLEGLAAETVRLGFLPRAGQLEAVKEADFLIVNKVRVDEELLAAAPRLRWLGVMATGTDNIDLSACTRRGVAVANVPGYSTHSVAQLTFALLLELCQSPAAFDRSVRTGMWRLGVGEEQGVLPLKELYGKTMGLVGCGDIGRQVARIAQAFGMRVLAYVRRPREEEGVRFVTLKNLLQESDVVSLHCPATPETEKIIDEKALAAMKPGALLINTARGRLVDEEALCGALHSGRLAGYGADVAFYEPPAENAPLRTAPHVVLTPHIAWATAESLDRLVEAVRRNLESYLEGKPENLVNQVNRSTR